jgi:phenol 2-monooxygenase
VGDSNPMHLGHHATADGRWRIYVFADPATPQNPKTGTASPTEEIAEWITNSPESPLAATPEGADTDAWFDLKVIYQQDHTSIDINAVPAVFKPQVGPFQLTDYEKVYATDPATDIFDLRGVDRGGVVVVVRPDQYVANVLPLTATAELGAFFAPLLPNKKSEKLTSAALRGIAMAHWATEASVRVNNQHHGVLMQPRRPLESPLATCGKGTVPPAHRKNV